MNVIFEPQFNSEPMSVDYVASGDKLTVTMNGVSEAFDFTNLPDGRLDGIEVETLPLNPIVFAKKEDGVLTLTLIRFLPMAIEREKTVTGVDGDGNEIWDIESDADFNARLTDWKNAQVREHTTI